MSAPAVPAYCPATAATYLVTVTLNTLGNTSDEVADNLRQLVVKGIPGDEGNCPIARFLLRLPEIVEVAVLEDHLVFWTRHHGLVVDLPEPIARFVALFNTTGPYLDLVDMPAVAS
jgi:hypothetical protein